MSVGTVTARLEGRNVVVTFDDAGAARLLAAHLGAQARLDLALADKLATEPVARTVRELAALYQATSHAIVEALS